MTAIRRLQELQLILPKPPKPLGRYVPAVTAGGMLLLSGMLPVKDGRPAWTGLVGTELSLDEGRQAARLAVLNGLAVIQAELGSLDRIKRVVPLTVHIAAGRDFSDHAAIADDASMLLASVFNETGGHARLAVGASSLPAKMPVELEMIFELR
jgi:enamine deaminase RidA (YjgF/YER057c/UK114 family)